MNRLARPSIDDLFARRVVKDYGTFSVVSLPGVNLSESEEAAFLAKLECVRPPSCTRIKLTWPGREENKQSRSRLLSMPMLSYLNYRRYPSRKSSLACTNRSYDNTGS